MRSRTLITAVIFVLVGSGIYYAYIKIRRALTYADSSVTIAPSDEKANMEISGFRLEETDGPDSVWTLKAKKAEMFKNSKRIIFTDVETQVNGDLRAKNTYNITSDQGAYFMDEDKIILEKNVTINTSQGYKIFTDRLDYSVKTKQIRSIDPVNIFGKTPGGQLLSIEGVGIDGSLGSGNLKKTRR